MKLSFENPKDKKLVPEDDANLKKFLESGSFKLVIEFDQEKVIGLGEAKRILDFHKEMLTLIKKEKDRQAITGNLECRLGNRVIDFDLTFIAALHLFKFSFGNVFIYLYFERLVYESEAEKCFYRFGNFAAAGLLSRGREILTIVRDGEEISRDFLIQNISAYQPFIDVSEDSFERLFQQPIKSTWEAWWGRLDRDNIDTLNKHKNHSDDLYKQLRQIAIARIDLQGDGGQNLENFHVLYAANALRQFHFIRRETRNRLRSRIQDGAGSAHDERVASLGLGLTREADRKYEDEVQRLFDRLLDKPPGFVMLFAYFIDQFYRPVAPENASHEEKLKTRVNLLTNIFYLTDELFYGVRELAKNIIEHSSNKRGVIIGKVLERKLLPGLKPGMCMESYLDGRPPEEHEFVDFIVMDDGITGIVEKTITNLEELKKEFVKYPRYIEKFETDIQNLKSGGIALADFYNPDEIKLQYQEIRSALSLGLLIFSHLVLENHGYMMVSSPGKNSIEGMALFENWQSRKEIEHLVPLGTFYNILFPKNLKQSPTPRSETVPFEMPSGESAFETVLKQVIECENGKGNGNPKGQLKETEPGPSPKSEPTPQRDKKICFISHWFKTGTNHSDVGWVADMFKRCNECLLKNCRKILSIDLGEGTGFDPSDLFRFLAKIQLTKDIKGIIIHGVKKEIVTGLIDIFRIFKRMYRKIGSSDHFVLFYYLPEGPIKKYFSFLLAGETLEDIAWINERIAKTNYTQKNLLELKNQESNPSHKFQKSYCSNPLFTDDGHLLPFDILIKRKGLSLFEKNVLANLLNPGLHPSSPSYTFKDAHMRLGSKIHLTDFFYARRIFQNSFYSLRFAYLVCRYINDNIEKWIDNKDTDAAEKSLTIMGYGMYSELLISNITRFLEYMLTDWRFNHAVVDDPEKVSVVGKLYHHVILIIPISSTLSTSRKIDINIKKFSTHPMIIGTPINILIVGNKMLANIIDENGVIIDETVNRFWKYLDTEKKMITPRSQDKDEKFFIYLPSRWYLPQECPLCYPNNPDDEVVLFETDKVSVTPSLIFDLPFSKKKTALAKSIQFVSNAAYQSNKEVAVITEKMLQYGHITRSRNHYLYYVDSNMLLNENQPLVKEWLLSVKSELKKNPMIFESKLILIAPTNSTNSNFINLVIEIVFNNAATLFHYDQDEDFIPNLKSFFGKDITDDALVFFVDNSMSSGSTFEKLNNFVKYTREGENSRGVDGAFILMNRLMEDKKSVIEKELGKAGFFAFVDLDVPIMIDSERFCHLCSEKKRYEKMLNGTLLDSLRILIEHKIFKMGVQKYNEKRKVETISDSTIKWRHFLKEKRLFGKPQKQSHYIRRLEFVHKLYRAFSDDQINKKETIEQIFTGYTSLENLCNLIGITTKSNQPCFSTNTLDWKVDLIKVLSNPYFVSYKEIHKYIFKIVIFEFKQTIQMLQSVENHEISLEHMDAYRYLKFLIKRAALLKANFVINDSIIHKVFSIHNMLLERLQDNKNIVSNLNKDERESFINNLHGFVDYYLLAVKETTWCNETKSLKLEETSKNIFQIDYPQNPIFLLLAESLRIENIYILLQFLDMVDKQVLEKLLDDKRIHFSESKFERDTDTLADAIIEYCLVDTYRSAPLMHFLGYRGAENLDENEIPNLRFFLENNIDFQSRLLPTILLKAFFIYEKRQKLEKNDGEPEVESDMDYILFCLSKILNIEVSSGGVFFVVKYMQAADKLTGSNLFTIGHIGKYREIDSFDWEKSFTSRVFEGYVPSFKLLPLTYVQLIKRNQTFCTHLGETIEKEHISELKHLHNIENLLLLRIAGEDIDSTARGIIGFYKLDSSIIKPGDLRYALILKNEIFQFIEKNYETYSFKLHEEKNRRLREMEELNRVIASVTSAADLKEVYKAIEKTKGTFENIDEMCLLTKKSDSYDISIKCPSYNTENCKKCVDNKLNLIKNNNTYRPYYSPDIGVEVLLGNANTRGLNSVFIIPLVFNEELLGIMDIRSKRKDAFPPFERSLLTNLGAQVAIAINNQIKQEKQIEIFKNISHSLGTHLTTIRGFTQNLIEGKVKNQEKREEYLNRLYRDVFSLINSVDEISSIANMEFWDGSSISETVVIMEVIENLAEKNRYLLEEKQLKLKTKGPGEQVYVKADKKKLEEAFQSLLNNAIKFSDRNKHIFIYVSTKGENVWIQIEDQGYGIHDEDKQKIFEKYERGRSAKERMITGTGIGLAVVKHIIEKHSGKISVESTLNKGSIFTIILPIIKDKRRIK